MIIGRGVDKFRAASLQFAVTHEDIDWGSNDTSLPFSYKFYESSYSSFVFLFLSPLNLCKCFPNLFTLTLFNLILKGPAHAM